MLRSILAVLICIIALFPAGLQAQSPPENPITSIAWKQDNTQIAVGYENGTIDIVDTTTGQVSQSLSPFTTDTYTSVSSLAWSPDGNFLAGGNRGGNVKVWNTGDWSLAANMAASQFQSVTLLTWNDDGSSLFVITDSLTVWDTQNEFQLIKVDINVHGPFQIGWNLNRTNLAIVGVGALGLFDPITFDFMAQIHEEFISVVAMSPNGEIIAGGTGLGKVTLWNSTTLDSIIILKNHVLSYTITIEVDFSVTAIRAVMFSSDGQTVSALQGNGLLMTWDTESFHLIDIRKLSGAPIDVAEFSPDGSQLAYGTATGDLIIVPVSPDDKETD